jgi:hypothetical protein
VAVVAEELGRALADTAFIGPTLAVELRRMAGLAMNSMPETVALAMDLGTLAVAPEGHMQESAVAVDAAGSASALVLTPSSGDDSSGNGSSGNDSSGDYRLGAVTVGAPEAVLDLTRPSAATDAFSPVVVLPGQVSALTSDQLLRWTAFGLAVCSADLVGTMRGAVRLACDYASSRRQYGVAVGSFQAVQHLLADAFVALEGSRSAALHAAWAIDALPAEEALAAASVAKAYSARAARTVCESAIQVHGGIGNTWDCLAHVFLRRALLSIDILGGEGACLGRVLRHHGVDHGVGGDDGLR